MVEPRKVSSPAAGNEAAIRRWLCERLAVATGLAPDGIDTREPFENLGITSTEAVSIAGELEEWLDCRLPQELLYEYVSVETLAGYLAGPAVTEREIPGEPGPAVPGRGKFPDTADDPLCISGMACQFPDADSPGEFWQNLLDGRDSAVEVPAERWDAAARLSHDRAVGGTLYTSRGAFMRDAAGFDAAFFDISPREASRMDPRQRILLELCWQTMEGSGLTADRLRGSRTGVFIGMMEDGQFATLQLDQGEECLDDPVFGTGTGGSVTAGRLSYRFNLLGPSVVVDTACSSALVALHLAMRSIAAGDCDQALVGGAGLTAHPDSVRQACAMRLLAVDGRTKTFDAAADGFLLGEGVGAVMVERLSAVVRRRGQVLAVLRGSAINQDGATNGLTAPSRPAQVDVIRRALANAGLDSRDLDYVEAHGTGTALGDAIEAAALHEVFIRGSSRGHPLVVGAVKTNIGHLTGAAGLAGLIKVVQALRHGRIPANLHLRDPNPAIDWNSETVTLPDHAMDWPQTAAPRRAGVSSFGWSGSNAHIVLEQPPPVSYAPRDEEPARDAWQALLLSSRTPGRISRVAAGLQEALDSPGGPVLADIAFTTQAGRSMLDHRIAVVTSDVASARRELAALSQSPLSRRAARHGEARVAFLMPGTGDQYPALGRMLYSGEPAFRDALRLCADAATAAGVDVLRWLYPEGDDARAAGSGGGLGALLGRADPAPSSPLTSQVEVAHAAVFALDFACAMLWQRIGVRPAAVLGYSLGEYAAATVAGVFDPADAMRLVIQRARLVAQAPRGAMLTVAAPASRLAGMLGTALDLAADNGPLASVAAGPETDIARLEAQLAQQGIACRRVPTTQAMHSRRMLSVRDRLIALIGSTRRQPPVVPMVSNLTGETLSAQQAMDPEYWGDHMCATVRLADGVQRLAEQGIAAIVDLGSGQLGSLATQVLSARPGDGAAAIAVGSLPPEYRRGSEREVLLRAAARLWEVGAQIDWSMLRPPGGRLAILPGYPFEHRRYWPGQPRDAAVTTAPEPAVPGANAVEPAAPVTNAAAQLYAPGWEPAPAPAGQAAPVGPVLLLTDDAGLGGRLAAALGPARCTLVRSGPRFTQSPDGFTVRPTSAADHQRLLDRLRDTSRLPRTIVHLWSAAQGSAAQAGDGAPADLTAAVRADHEAGFGSLLALGQALPRHLAPGVRLLVVTAGGCATRPGEPVRPGRGTLAGLALTLPQEHPGIVVRTLDLPVPELSEPARQAGIAASIVAELSWPGPEPAVAIRGGVRLVRRYRQVPRPAIPASSASAVSLRERGVYLITGGLGRIGLLTAAHLARRARARLVLTGRQGLPPRDRWADLLASAPNGSAPNGSAPDTSAPDRDVQRIRAVLDIEAQGAEVMVAALDVSDPGAVRGLLDLVEARFGTLNGVIHAAGTTLRSSFAPIADLDLQSVSPHVVPKVYGTLALDAALAGRSLDFCVAMSSMSAVLGGVAFAGYAAANAFLDLFAESAAGRQRWTAIDWDTWQTTVDGHVPGDLRSALDRYSIPPAAGVELLEVLLGGERPRVIVAAGDLEQRLAQWATPADPFSDAGPPAAGPAAGAPAAPAADRPDLPVPYVGPQTETQRRIARLWSAAIGIQQIGIHDNFFDLGGNSLVGMQLVTSLTREFARAIPTVVLFEAPTVAAMAEYFDGPQAVAAPAPPPDAPGLVARDIGTPAAAGIVTPPADRDGDVAIIGMAGRFPGADDVNAFWKNLAAGVESLTFFSPEDLRAAGVPAEQSQRADYIAARPVLSTVGDFDAEFFGYTPRDASLADPQQRLFLECVWECLEDAGYPPRSTTVPVGVFGGTNISTYLLRLAATPESLAGINEFQVVISNDKDSLTLNASYRLDLRGPSVTVQSFCSTSLLAVHLACRSLADGECEMAVAGGVSIRVPDRVGYISTPGGMESVDGHVRAFDAQAGGAAFGDGCAVVVLKPLRRAIEDGDNVVAVIRGSAVNNDGALKVGFSAPSVRGQSQVVARAQAAAGVDPRTVTYVEAHGTATELGDPIEVAALTRAFGNSDTQYCAIGSVKTNVGHLDRAAGAAGLIKTALALQHRLIPASLNFSRPNPEIDFAHSPFWVNTELLRWEPPAGHRLRAGVNSLGMGGTNVHVVLEEAPDSPVRPPAPGRPEALVVSARTPESLAAARTNLARYLTEYEGDLLDVAFTLQTGREGFEHRLGVLASSAAEAAAMLSDQASAGSSRVRRGQVPAGVARPVFGLPEPDACPDAARMLYQGDAQLRGRLDALRGSFPDLLEVLAGSGEVAPADGVRAGLLVQYVIAAELERCGVRPAAILAQGAAWCTAAALAGVLPVTVALAAPGYPGTAPAGALAQPRIPCLLARRGQAVPVSLADPASWAAAQAEPGTPLAGRIILPQESADAVPVLLALGPAGPGRLVAPDWSGQLIEPWPTAAAASGEPGGRALVASWLAELWLHGIDVDWAALHAGRRPRRTSLPTYPFQRSRYWIDPAASGPGAAAPADAAAGLDLSQQLAGLGTYPPDKWFWRPGWRSAPDLPAPPAADLAEPWLLFADSAGLARRTASKLRAAGGSAILVSRGPQFEQAKARSYTLDPDNPEHYLQLMHACREHGWTPRVVGYFWSLDTGETAAEPAAAGRLLQNLVDLMRALDADGTERRIRVVTAGAYRVVGDEPVAASLAVITGPVLVTPVEYPQLDTRLVDVVTGGAAGGAAGDRLSRALLAELADRPGERRVAVRGGRRWVPDLQRLDLPPAPDPGSVLRQRGVYLITGGLGGIGLALAQRLAATCSARLVLVTRRGLPEPAQWDALVADPACAPELVARIEAVRDLQAGGTEVQVIPADVAQPQQCADAVAAALERFGRLDGVIHAAGVPGNGLMALKDPAVMAEVLAPKVAGTAALLTALAGVPVDFVVLFSSLAALTGGGPGRVDYCSASAYLDAVAQAASGTPRIVSIDWGEWQWNGWDLALEGFGEAAAQFLRANRQRVGIGFDEGWRCLIRALAMTEPQLVVSPQQVPDLIAVTSRLTVADIAALGAVPDAAAGGTRHARPRLSTPFEPAPEGLAAQIAELWGASLGLEKVGMQDNFFELGGNSLLAVGLIARIRGVTGGAAIPPHVLYQVPTVGGLVSYLSGSGNGAGAGADSGDARNGAGLSLRRDRGFWRRENAVAAAGRRRS